MVTSPEIIAELNQIADQHAGLVHPEHVVAAAVDPKSALHSWFEWDDGEAADRWRLSQARQLLRVTVSHIAGEERPASRVFVSLTTDREEGGYRSTVAVLSNKDYRQQLLADALEELQSFERKYSALKELAEVFSVIKKVVRRKPARRIASKVPATTGRRAAVR